MWKNGFSIDEGELRDYYDAKNRLFLMSVMSGRIPPELITDAKGGEVHVNMEDHKDEDYKKPKVLSEYLYCKTTVV
jgi:UBX domain-containing protein 1